MGEANLTQSYDDDLADVKNLIGSLSRKQQERLWAWIVEHHETLKVVRAPSRPDATLMARLTEPGHSELTRAQNEFMDSLQHDDDLGVILRAHLHLEMLLTALLLRHTYNATAAIDALGYYKKVEVASTMGLIPSQLAKQLKQVGALRNAFAHTLDRVFTSDDADALVRTLAMKQAKVVEQVVSASGPPFDDSPGGRIRVALVNVRAGLEFLTLYTTYIRVDEDVNDEHKRETP